MGGIWGGWDSPNLLFRGAGEFRGIRWDPQMRPVGGPGKSRGIPRVLIPLIYGGPGNSGEFARSPTAVIWGAGEFPGNSSGPQFRFFKGPGNWGELDLGEPLPYYNTNLLCVWSGGTQIGGPGNSGEFPVSPMLLFSGAGEFPGNSTVAPKWTSRGAGEFRGIPQYPHIH